MVARCDCCDLPVESCGRAIERRAEQEDANARWQALALYGWFRARFPGSCIDCGEPFKIGTPISYDAERDGYRAYCCL